VGGEAAAIGAASAPSVERFAGRYELRECLGASPDADTWKALDETGRWVVLKRLHDGTELDQAAAAEWLRVQRTLATLGSPWVVATLDAAGGDRCLYVVRPYARARTLRSILDQRRPPRAVALHWARQIAAGLGALHAAGVVHASVRPENVLIDGGGVARWIDPGATLGRARRADGPDAPPEWAEGRAPDAASDVFGLGALLETLLLDAEDPGSRPDDELRRLVHACLLEDPGLRPAGAAAVLAALDRVD
jgi:serine/threonine protein kinase